ncbi:MAG: leucine-rich repeat domain-containing protein [Faecalibacterium sp.]|nr:leucine-rich repeat domain-containing protein [Ruminococcus sp.]MCM1391523.1 leucine-rich repeat domain-containing protein [Ruminococcus sp.]MCM1485511.1 leucine-rich repeat domain-containing protein [Faecalibacterium sp.]
MKKSLITILILIIAILFTACNDKVNNDDINISQNKNEQIIEETTEEIISNYDFANVEDTPADMFVYEEGDFLGKDKIVHGISIKDYLGDNEIVKIPETIDNLPVLVISSDAFRNNQIINYVYMPDNVIFIEPNAFNYCKALKEVHLSENIYNIGNEAFAQCEQLVNINLPSNLTCLGWSAFSNCYELKNVTIPATLDALCPYTFNQCKNLTRVDLSKTQITEIGERVFQGCILLKEVILPTTLETIEPDAFYSSGLSKLKIGTNNSGFFVEDDILYQDKKVICSALDRKNKNVVIKDGTETIGYLAFAHSNIESVTVPASCEYVGRVSFHCDNLKRVDFLADDNSNLDVHSQTGFEYIDNIEIHYLGNVYTQETIDEFYAIFN